MTEISLDNLTEAEIQTGGVQFMQLCRLTSPDEAVALCKKFGGTQVRMPVEEGGANGKFNETDLRTELRKILCASSYKKLLYEVGGTYWEFPMLSALIKLRRNRQIKTSVDAAYKSGVGFEKHLRELSMRYGLTRRHLYRIMKMPD